MYFQIEMMHYLSYLLYIQQVQIHQENLGALNKKLALTKTLMESRIMLLR